MAGIEWTDPATVEEALAQLVPAAVPKAGGIDLMDRLKERLDAPSRLVNLRSVRGLDAVRERAGRIEIGSMVTLARLAEHELVRAKLPALAEAAGSAATPNVRNAATVGGNLLQRPRCWYFRQEAFPCRRKGGTTCFALEGRSAYHGIFRNDVCAMVHPSDTATVLSAHDARIEIAARGGRREIGIDELFIPPGEDVTREHRISAGELLVGVHVPLPPPGTATAYVRQSERDSADWPLATAAVVLALAGGVCRRASIVLGAAAGVPWRAR